MGALGMPGSGGQGYHPALAPAMLLLLEPSLEGKTGQNAAQLQGRTLPEVTWAFSLVFYSSTGAWNEEPPEGNLYRPELSLIRVR